jgi:hypothetical protein
MLSPVRSSGGIVDPLAGAAMGAGKLGVGANGSRSGGSSQSGGTLKRPESDRGTVGRISVGPSGLCDSGDRGDLQLGLTGREAGRESALLTFSMAAGETLIARDAATLPYFST